jgi:hypothetical protein
MELVRGIRITDYCDQHQLPTRDRLELFIQVCRAVQHAHQKGIIHRDLKPSNILVTLHDGVPVPKVIDFGIAKATEGRLTDATVYTQLHQFIGTPAYMSPEQAELSGLDIDTRSDIYSLGVLLYELLTGRTPFDARELMSQGLDAMRKTIREREPPRPSTRLIQELARLRLGGARGRLELGGARGPRAASGGPPEAGPAREVVGEAREPDGVFGGPPKTARAPRALPEENDAAWTVRPLPGELRTLINTLRGDLDWIVMKCLEKDRGRRYETANGLAMDLKRHLSHEPVVARPPSKAYKVSKFIRRNKPAVAAGTAVVLALVLGFGSATVMFLRERAVVRALKAEKLAGVVDRAMFAAMSGDSDAMNLALSEARSNHVSGGQIKLLEGLHDLTSGNSGEALRHLREATHSMPDSVAAHALLAAASIYENRYQDFLALIAKLADLEARSFEDYLFKGHALSLDNPAAGLPLLDRAVAANSSALAHTLRAGARAARAMDSGQVNEIEDALADVATARGRSVSQRNVTLLTTSCHAHIVAANIYRRAGDAIRSSNHLAQAELDGLELERFSANPAAARWRIWQLELAGREEDALRYMERLNREGKGRNAPVQASYGAALLVRGEPEKALAAFDSVAHSDWIAAVRPLALFELPDRRDEFQTTVARFVESYPPMARPPMAPAFLLYSGRRPQARELANDVLMRHSEWFNHRPPAEKRSFEYLAGRLAEGEFLNAARGSLIDLCVAHCVIGFQHLADGDRAGAMEHFRQAVEMGAFLGPAYDWARVVPAQLKRHATWPPTP